MLTVTYGVARSSVANYRLLFTVWLDVTYGVASLSVTVWLVYTSSNNKARTPAERVRPVSGHTRGLVVMGR